MINDIIINYLNKNYAICDSIITYKTKYGNEVFSFRNRDKSFTYSNYLVGTTFHKKYGITFDLWNPKRKSTSSLFAMSFMVFSDIN